MARRRRRRKKLASSTRAYAIITASLIEIAVFVLAIFLHTRGVEFGTKVLTAAGTICIIASFAGIILSVRDVFEPEYNLLSRIFGMFFPVVTFILWAGTYLIGFVSL